MMNRTLLIICLLINGCASTTNRPIDPVMYKGSTTSKSELIGFLRMNTGEVTGYSPAAMIYVDPSFRPVLYNTYDAYPNYLFEEENLEVFFESLKTELLERGMIRSLSSSYSPDKLEIVVNFIQAESVKYLFSLGYRFDVMLLLKHGQVTDYKIYSIVSPKVADGFEVDFMKAKSKAAEKVLATVIPDIDKFISKLPE